MNPNTSTHTIVESSEDAIGITDVHTNHRFYDHMETNADTHSSTNDPNQVAWDGSLYAPYGGPHQQDSISMMNAFNAQDIQTNESAVVVDSGGMFQ
jgi:hypothetical protein